MIVENDLLEADFAVLEEVVALVARGFLRAFQEGLWGLVLGGVLDYARVPCRAVTMKAWSERPGHAVEANS